MKTFVAILCLVLTGCAAPTGQGSRLLPWNWFHADANARLEKAETRTEVAENQAVHAAHVETFKAGLALALVSDSPPVALARRTLGNGNGLLAQVAPLTAAEDAQARKLVDDLLSGAAERVASAERAQQAAEGQSNRLSRELAAAQATQATAQAGLASANLENATTAAKYRRLWFWIYAVAGGWFVVQLLSGVARFYPGLAPIARVAGFFSAPAVQASYDRVTTAAGRALADAERWVEKGPNELRTLLDAHTDAADQVAIKAQFHAAS